MKRVEFSPRPATEADLDQVAEIERQSIAPPWTRSAFAAELEKKHSRFWVLTDNATDEKVLAYSVLSFPGEQAHLLTFAVHPEQRRKGLGIYLLRRLIAYVQRRGGESVVLEVRRSNAPALQLYQSLGFIITHTITRLYPDGEDGYSLLYKISRDEPTGDAIVDFDSDSGAPSGNQNLN